MIDGSDEAQLKKASQWAKLDDKARHQALAALLSDSVGRAYVYDLLHACGVFRNSFSTDPIQMAYNVGQTSIGLWIMADVEACNPAAYQKMINERNQRNADRTNVLDSIAGNGSSGPGEPAGESGEQGDDSKRFDPFRDLQNPVSYD